MIVERAPQPQPCLCPLLTRSLFRSLSPSVQSLFHDLQHNLPAIICHVRPYTDNLTLTHSQLPTPQSHSWVLWQVLHLVYPSVGPITHVVLTSRSPRSRGSPLPHRILRPRRFRVTLGPRCFRVRCAAHRDHLKSPARGQEVELATTFASQARRFQWGGSVVETAAVFPLLVQAREQAKRVGWSY
jgi:hypothetical protein